MTGMQRSRRTILASLGAGLTTTGCLGRAQDADTVTQQTGQQTDAVTRLADRTQQVMSELAWFATDYPSALTAYQDTGTAVLTAIQTAGEAVPLTPRDVDRLDGGIDRPRIDQGWPYDYEQRLGWDPDEKLWRYVDIDWQSPDPANSSRRPLPEAARDQIETAIDTFATTFAEVFEPHFTGANRHRLISQDALETIDRFVARSDTAMVVAALVRLYRHFQTVLSDRYIERELSNDPIRNQLTEFLQAPSLDDPEFPPLFELDYRGQAPHTAFAYSQSVSDTRRRDLLRAEPLATIDGAIPVPTGATLQNVVQSLSVSAGRSDRCYLTISEWIRIDLEGYPVAELPSVPVYLQRYLDARTAERAAQTLFDRPDVSRLQPTVQLTDDGIQWTVITFPYEGVPWYSAYRRAGRHLICLAPAKRPFEHRTEDILGFEWRRPIRLSWLVER